MAGLDSEVCMAGLASRVCPGGGDPIWHSGQSGGTTILGGPLTA